MTRIDTNLQLSLFVRKLAKQGKLPHRVSLIENTTFVWTVDGVEKRCGRETLLAALKQRGLV